MIFGTVFTPIECFRIDFGDGLPSHRDRFGADVPLSDRLRKINFPIICPYLPPSGVFLRLSFANFDADADNFIIAFIA
jgi:hypothetical protein